MKQIKLHQFLVILSIIFCISSLPFLNLSFSQFTLNINSLLNNIEQKHVARLYKLTLSGVDTNVQLNINSSNKQLDITNGIVVWESSYSKSDLSSVWWWTENKIEEGSNYAWIAWWTNNKIQGAESVIWWWKENTINWSNAVIAWGQKNSAGNNWVVAWWNNNSASDNGIALWWQSNNADENSLVMWSWAGWRHAFARNAQANDDAARIDTKNGVLIGTTEGIQWVNLVVSGAVKIAWNIYDEWQAWEIRVVSGCFYAHDWKYWHVISQTNDPDTNCTWFVSTEPCKFGNVYLQQWDQVTGYNAKISSHCDGKKVVCSGGVLVRLGTNDATYSNPYCHKI